MLSFAAIFILNLAWAGCRDHVPTAPDVPECPPNASVLNDGYPAKAAFISGYYAETGVVDSFARAALESNASKPPQVFILASAEQFQTIKDKVMRNATVDQREKWSQALTNIDAIDFQWMQDFMISRVDSETGKNSLAPIEPMGLIYGNPRVMQMVYSSVSESVGKNCDVSAGLPLKDPSMGKDFGTPGVNPSGFGGGNIEGGPAGLCIVGQDHLTTETVEAYSKLACGQGTVVNAPTSWLQVGHADEIGTTVRFGPGPCDEAYLITSPRQALKVLRANPKELAFPHLDKVISGTWIGHEIGYDECYAMFDLMAGVLENTEPPKSTTELRFIPQAYAKFESKSHPGGLTSDELVACGHMTNLQLAQIYQSLYGKYMATVQKELDEFASTLATEWKKARPECAPNIIEIPALYRARSWPVGPMGKERVITRGFPIHLPPVNGLQMGQTLMMPDPKNIAFQKDIRERLKILKLNAKFFDTERSNKNGGNLHCLTNTIRYCRPRAAQ